jgi:hypothetical protein
VALLTDCSIDLERRKASPGAAKRPKKAARKKAAPKKKAKKAGGQ